MLKKLVLTVLILMFQSGCSYWTEEVKPYTPQPIVEETKVLITLEEPPKPLGLHFTTEENDSSDTVILLKVDKYNMVKGLPFNTLIDVLQYTSDLASYQKYLLNVVKYYQSNIKDE